MESQSEDLQQEWLVSPGAGGGTVRIGNTIRRPPERASKAMLLILAHLEKIGFNAAPRFLGKDDIGRYILNFIPGDVAIPPYPAWAASNKTLASVAILLRRYHDAIADLGVPSDIQWPRYAPPPFEGNIICHMDVSMANVVCRNGTAIALIDFEEVGPAATVWDVARTIRHWAPLLDPIDLPIEFKELAEQQAKRLALFVDNYQLLANDRARLIDAILLNADASYDRMRQYAAAGHAGYLREWTGGAASRNRRSRAWIAANRQKFENALGF